MSKIYPVGYSGMYDPDDSADIPIDQYNAPILAELDRLDAKSIRPLRVGDNERVAALESQAAALRLKLRK